MHRQGRRKETLPGDRDSMKSRVAEVRALEGNKTGRKEVQHQALGMPSPGHCLKFCTPSSPPGTLQALRKAALSEWTYGPRLLSDSPTRCTEAGLCLALHLPSFAVTLIAPLTVGSLLRARHSNTGPLKAHHPDKEMALDWSSDTTTLSTYLWWRNKPLQDFVSQNSEHLFHF